jgi:histone H3/H4
MTPLEAAELRLQTAAAVADERDRTTVKGTDIRIVLAELARLREVLLGAPRD